MESVHFIMIAAVEVIAIANPPRATKLFPNVELNLARGERLPLKLNFVISSVTFAIISPP